MELLEKEGWAQVRLALPSAPGLQPAGLRREN
jgi:hypothetical protein